MTDENKLVPKENAPGVVEVVAMPSASRRSTCPRENRISTIMC